MVEKKDWKTAGSWAAWTVDRRAYWKAAYLAELWADMMVSTRADWKAVLKASSWADTKDGKKAGCWAVQRV